MDEKTPIVQILDPNYNGMVELAGKDGSIMIFQKVMLAPLDGKVYSILKPTKKIEGVDKDEAIVFRIDYLEKTSQFFLALETRQEIVEKIFELYVKASKELS